MRWLVLLALLGTACGPTRPREPPSVDLVPDRECVARCEATDAICTNGVRGRHGLRADSLGSLLPALIDAWFARREHQRCADALARCYDRCAAPAVRAPAEAGCSISLWPSKAASNERVAKRLILPRLLTTSTRMRRFG